MEGENDENKILDVSDDDVHDCIDIYGAQYELYIINRQIKYS